MDAIRKQKLNIILLIDKGISMQGRRMEQVNLAINQIQEYLNTLQEENSYVDFYLTLITFSNEFSFYDDKLYQNISDFKYHGITCEEESNISKAYEALSLILKSKCYGGIMPDFGGLTPIILLLTDGEFKKVDYKQYLDKLYQNPWFNASMRYGIGIDIHEKGITSIIRDFIGKNGDVIKCFSNSMLKDIIKIIVMTISKEKSTCANSRINHQDSNPDVKSLIDKAIYESEVNKYDL